MVIRIIDADDLGKDGYRLTVDLDADAPAPAADDPARVLTLTFGSYESSKNDGETRVQYRNRIKREAQALAREAAQRRAAQPAKLAELIGQDLT